MNEQHEAAQVRSRQEIEYLKGQWEADPCWDLEETEGFELHREELAEFARQKGEERRAREQDRLEARAIELGIPGNAALVTHLERLESQIDRLEERLDRYTDRLDSKIVDMKKRADRRIDSVRSEFNDHRDFGRH